MSFSQSPPTSDENSLNRDMGYPDEPAKKLVYTDKKHLTLFLPKTSTKKESSDSNSDLEEEFRKIKERIDNLPDDKKPETENDSSVLCCLFCK